MPVALVNATKIFACLDTEAQTQVLVYDMHVDTDNICAMILPLPVLPKTEVEFTQIQDNFFQELAICFTIPSRSGIPKVHECGSFIASFIPTMEELGNLDPQFKLPEGLSLPAIYDTYGFAVLQIKPKCKTHPVGIKFKTDIKKCYFPCLHIHDGEIHDTDTFDHVLFGQSKKLPEDVETPRKNSYFDRGEGAKFLRKDWTLWRRTMKGNFKNADVWI